MIKPSYTESLDRYVIKFGSNTELQNLTKQAKPLATVERVIMGHNLIIIKLPATLTADSTPCQIWQFIDQYFENFLVMPIFIDSMNENRIPTGTLSVRFHAIPDDKTLAEFVVKHSLIDLKLRRNKFMPQQVMFGIPRNKVYLSELVATVTQDDLVLKAWPNTLTQFERE